MEVRKTWRDLENIATLPECLQEIHVFNPLYNSEKHITLKLMRKILWVSQILPLAICYRSIRRYKLVFEDFKVI